MFKRSDVSMICVGLPQETLPNQFDVYVLGHELQWLDPSLTEEEVQGLKETQEPCHRLHPALQAWCSGRKVVVACLVSDSTATKNQMQWLARSLVVYSQAQKISYMEIK